MGQAIIYMDKAMVWELMVPGVTPEHLGLIPQWFNAHDELPAVEQANNGYMQSAGCPFSPHGKWEIHGKIDGPLNGQLYLKSVNFPEDRALRAIARTQIRDETIVMWEGEWLSIVDKDGGNVTGHVD